MVNFYILQPIKKINDIFKFNLQSRAYLRQTFQD